MVNKLLQLLSIRCSHKKTSQPFAASEPAPKRVVNEQWSTPTRASRHYVVCLDCGHKLEYDWTNMRITGE